MVYSEVIFYGNKDLYDYRSRKDRDKIVEAAEVMKMEG